MGWLLRLLELLEDKPLIEFKAPVRAISKVYIHCSASDHKEHDNVTTIREWHLKRNFSDIGYHFIITKDGIIHDGRNIEKRPAAQKGYNTGSIAICLTGLEEFSQEQFTSLRELCKAINYELDVTFHGHCEVDKLKTCPVFDYKKVLRLDKNGNMRV